MDSQHSISDMRPALWRGAGPTLAALALLAGGLIIGGLLIWQAGARERARETALWQRQLTLAADAQARGTTQWLDSARGIIAKLADNTALRLYMAERALTGDATEAAAQERYLANLLQLNAGQGGFTAQQQTPSPIAANVARPPAPGLALLDGDGRIIVTTDPAIAHPRALLDAASQGLALAGPSADDDATLPLLRVAAPVFGVQADSTSSAPIGHVYGVRAIGPALAPLFEPGPGADGAASRLLAPAAAGQRRDLLTGATAPSDPVEAWALAAGTGTAVLMDGAGQDVLAAAQPVAGTGWVVLRQIGKAQALGAVEKAMRQRGLLLIVAMMAAAGAVLLLWRHGASLRVARAAQDAAQAQDRSAKLARFLKLVSDGQTMAIFVLNETDQIVFANQRAAAMGGAAQDDLNGKSLAAILGQAAAAPLARLVALARARREPSTASVALAFDENAIRRGRADAVPLDPAVYGGDGDMLLLWDDLTPLLAAQERTEQSLENLIAVLSGLIDARDPYSAEQSRRVALLAASVARACDMAERETRAVHIAGMLMNLGKLLVPRSLLVKAGTLDEAERGQIHSAITRANSLIAQVDFDAPVAAALSAIPSGDQPLPAGAPATARLLVVVNAFVGMVSPRAHRPALDIEAALATLRGQHERYDPAMISALAHVLDNQGWRDRVQIWAQGTAR